ncbi:unnamed protein product [Calypogeia fissa]
MAGFTNGFCTTEITNVDMDLETTTKEALPCSHEDGPLAIVECLPATEKELGDSVLESIVECLPRTEKELGEDGPLAIVECLPATEKELASARDNSTFLGEEELDAGKNLDASTTGLDVVQVPEGLVAGNENEELTVWNPPDRPTPVTKKGWSVISSCDKIQYPPSGEFDSTALHWFGSRCDFAWIPADRLMDFIWGENMRDSFHTQFATTKTMDHKIHGSGPLEKTVTWYNCCFGPTDKRPLKEEGVPEKLKSKEDGVFLKRKIQTGKLCSI